MWYLLRRTAQYLIRMILCVLIGIILLALIARLSYRPLPELQLEKTAVSSHHAPSALADVISLEAQEHPQLSAIYPFSDGLDAFAARLALVNEAERSLDLQYYIWHDDMAGLLLFDAVYKAAQRGVQVRLLLDDNNTLGMDGLLLSLDAHPNIEVRLFNPFMQRNHRVLAYLSDFMRLNRRMHNKSFTVDAALSIVGGRNIGDEYFNAGEGISFVDMDVAVIGEVVGDIQADFERYWHSRSAYPLSLIIPKYTATQPIQKPKDSNTQKYRARLQSSRFVQHLEARDLPFIWGKAQFLSDHPDKVLGKNQYENSVFSGLVSLFSEAQENLLLVSPYFVPTERGVQWLSDLHARGVQIEILTNSLTATDVSPVHAGYAKYRKPMLKIGFSLYELKPGATFEKIESKGNAFTRLNATHSASLHAKTFVIDNKKLFVGSFNFDPRSVELNTEMGLIFEQAQLTREFRSRVAQHLPAIAYQIKLNEEKQLEWHGRTAVHYQEPDATWWRRASVVVLSYLPIEWLL